MSFSEKWGLLCVFKIRASLARAVGRRLLCRGDEAQEEGGAAEKEVGEERKEDGRSAGVPSGKDFNIQQSSDFLLP